MSDSQPCENPKEHRQDWRVHMRNHNRSAFNGYHATPSDYSGVVCLAPGCRGAWRSKGAYVDTLPDINEQERLTWRAEPRDAQPRSKEWARLGSQEIRKRTMAEFCEYCGATETTPCMSKNRTTLWDYLHADRYQAAVWTFNAERRETVGPLE